MKDLLAIGLLLIALCLHAQSAWQTKEPVAERWEIVTDLYIGVQTEALTAEERPPYGQALPQCQGLRIKRVIPGSPAEHAGLQAGDLILKNNGAAIDAMEDLLLSLRNNRPGDFIHFQILRDGTKLPIRIRVEALPKPVVVAYATLPPRDLPNLSIIADTQSRIARLLADEIPHLQALHHEFATINSLFPNLARPGQIRLYYETERGYITVTGYPGKITVTVQRGLELETYHLKQQGDQLPALVRETFAAL